MRYADPPQRKGRPEAAAAGLRVNSRRSSSCDLSLARWGIEAFFKKIKQTLQPADSPGTSENVIKWQIWTALLTYLLLRLTAWIGEWKRLFRRFFALVKSVIGSQKRLSALIALVGKEEQATYPPVRLSVVRMRFDFGEG